MNLKFRIQKTVFYLWTLKLNNEKSFFRFIEQLALDDYTQWLKNNTIPFPEVQEKWGRTAKYRIDNFPPTIEDYLQTFPALKLPLGYVLLLQDFTNLYPDKDNLLFSSWPKLFKKIIKLAEARNDSYLKEIIKNYYTQRKDDTSGNSYTINFY